MTDDATRLWCSALPFAVERPLTAAERTLVAARRTLHGRAALRTVALVVSVWALTLVFVSRFGLRREFVAPLVALVLGASVLTLGGLVLVARNVARRALLRRDLAAGTVLVFTGPAVEASEIDPRLRTPSRARSEFDRVKADLDSYRSSEHTLDLLAASRSALAFDGRALARWVRIEPVRVATQPAHAAVAAEWVRASDASRADAPHVHQRALNDAECDELQRYVRTILYRPSLGTVLVTAYVVTALAAALRSPGHTTAFAFALRSTVAVMLVTAFVRRWRVARRFARDERGGMVVIVRAPRVPSTVLELGPPVEVLPRSGAVWTDAGRPGLWRVRGAR